MRSWEAPRERGPLGSAALWEAAGVVVARVRTTPTFGVEEIAGAVPALCGLRAAGLLVSPALVRFLVQA